MKINRIPFDKKHLIMPCAILISQSAYKQTPGVESPFQWEQEQTITRIKRDQILNHGQILNMILKKEKLETEDRQPEEGSEQSPLILPQ